MYKKISFISGNTFTKKTKKKNHTFFFTRYLDVKYEKQNTLCITEKNQQFFYSVIATHIHAHVTIFDALILQ